MMLTSLSGSDHHPSLPLIADERTRNDQGWLFNYTAVNMSKFWQLHLWLSAPHVNINDTILH